MIHPSEAAGHTDYRALAARLGHDVLERRILKQASLWAREVHQGEGFFKLEHFIPLDSTIRLILRITGFYRWGNRNFLDLRVVRRDVTIPGLPAAFDGYRILQLADLHCDLDPALMDVLKQRLAGLEYDLVVLTGDYHNKIAQDHDASLALLGDLIQHLKLPAYAVLGNHDFIEKVAFLEAAGIPVLLNEAVALERDGARLWLCGVDDPHFFQTHDLAKARRDVPSGEPTILLSHSPETYREAEALGYSYMLSGHTHGGQFCLPGGIAILCNAPVPRSFLNGPWRHGRLQGYTSPGTGGSGVAARFFCPPEITLHTLRCGDHPN